MMRTLVLIAIVYTTVCVTLLYIRATRRHQQLAVENQRLANERESAIDMIEKSYDQEEEELFEHLNALEPRINYDTNSTYDPYAPPVQPPPEPTQTETTVIRNGFGEVIRVEGNGTSSAPYRIRSADELPSETRNDRGRQV